MGGGVGGRSRSVEEWVGSPGHIFTPGVHCRVHYFRRTSVPLYAFNSRGCFLIFHGKYSLNQKGIIDVE